MESKQKSKQQASALAEQEHEGAVMGVNAASQLGKRIIETLCINKRHL